MWSFGDAVVLSGGCSLLIHKGGESCRATCTWDLRYEIICEVDLQQERQGQSLEQMMQTRRQKQRKENSIQDRRARTTPILSWAVNIKILLFLIPGTNLSAGLGSLQGWSRLQPLFRWTGGSIGRRRLQTSFLHPDHNSKANYFYLSKVKWMCCGAWFNFDIYVWNLHF